MKIRSGFIKAGLGLSRGGSQGFVILPSTLLANMDDETSTGRFSFKSTCLAFLLLLLAFSASAQHASVETVQFHSDLINETLPYNVILPRGFRWRPLNGFPVLLLFL